MRLRRHIFTVLIFPLLGAVVNVLVAIALGIWAFPIDANGQAYTAQEAMRYWNPRVEESEKYNPFSGNTYVTFGVDEIVINDGYRRVGQPHIPYKITMLISGFPARSMVGEFHISKNKTKAVWSISNPFGDQARTYRSGRSTSILPLRPIWSGFVINTIFFTVILWLFFDLFTIRLYIRRMRGCCIKCNYNLRGDLASGCPECGWKRGED